MGIIKKHYSSLSKQMSKGIQKQNIPKDVLEQNLKKKKEYETQFEEIQDKFNKYYEEFIKEKKLIE